MAHYFLEIKKTKERKKERDKKKEKGNETKRLFLTKHLPFREDKTKLWRGVKKKD